MQKIILFFLSVLFFIPLIAQKKPLDHSVYDAWQNIGERYISNNGAFVVFTITPQEGDGVLVIKKINGDTIAIIERGYLAKITEDSKYVICKIKPTYQQTRTARIQKKLPADLPKDSLAIIEVATKNIERVAKVKSYKLPEKNSNILLYLLEKTVPTVSNQKPELDSVAKVKYLVKMIDSLKAKLTEIETNGIVASSVVKKDIMDKPKSIEDPFEEGTDLVLYNLYNKTKQTVKLVSEYFISKQGNIAFAETTKRMGNSNIKPTVLRFDINKNATDTIFRKFNDAKGFSMDEDGNQLAFVAERDSSAKALQKYYALYYFKFGLDSCIKLADRKTTGLPTNYTIAEFANISFSKSGKRLFVGTAPILPVKDTTLPEFERVSVDVWNHKDDDLQTVQLKNLEQDLKRNYLARFSFETLSLIQLGNPKLERVVVTNEGDGDVFYATSDYGKRVQRQWLGGSINDVYSINPITGESKLIQANFKGNLFPSSTGKYVVMYNDKPKNYTIYDAVSNKITPFATSIKVPLYDIENDVPDDANPYGVMAWHKNDSAVYLYDTYDIWKVSVDEKRSVTNITNGLGRKNQLTFRYINTNRDERFVETNQPLLLSVFNTIDKGSGIQYYINGSNFSISPKDIIYPTRLANVVKAKDASVLSFSMETYKQSANIKVVEYAIPEALNITKGIVLHQPNKQQDNYNWGTAELFKWKAYTGKETEGILYKPEDFDAKKKYPMIVYFYERNNNTLYNYQAPAPTPSRLNISFFVSRGYIVFVPDIWYKTGYPGKSAYDYIVSGTRALIQKGFIDSTKIGLQGQSWGGYQTAYLIGKTNLYAAAWAGAPVVNMFSAYGGIRWESGVNRQFQYEKTQSRIGATIWERQDLYIENSPLFTIPKVKTPLVIMSNDADGAVPWYQGIEYFTAMRRLSKPVWLLNYNGEAHNLIERKNRKDIQIREQQFFDWLLKGEQPAPWLQEGVPAVLKGRTWGF